MNKTTEALDLIEKLLIKTMMPIVRQLLPNAKEEDLERNARNMLGHIGSRITFGKELYDKTITDQLKEKV